MSTPQPVPPTLPPPTPQKSPTLFGMVQAAATAWGAFKLSEKAGVPPEYAILIAGSVASGVTSSLHAWAQKLHRKELV